MLIVKTKKPININAKNQLIYEASNLEPITDKKVLNTN